MINVEFTTMRGTIQQEQIGEGWKDLGSSTRLKPGEGGVFRSSVFGEEVFAANRGYYLALMDGQTSDVTRIRKGQVVQGGIYLSVISENHT